MWLAVLEVAFVDAPLSQGSAEAVSLGKFTHHAGVRELICDQLLFENVNLALVDERVFNKPIIKYLFQIQRSKFIPFINDNEWQALSI